MTTSERAEKLRVIIQDFLYDNQLGIICGKHWKCPKCGSTDLGDRWCNGRKLQQYCSAVDEIYGDDCGWKGEPRTPEKFKVENTKRVRIDTFCGWDYIVYDKFGHTMTISQTFNSEGEAMEDLAKELKYGETDKDAGPYTGVLFHTPVKVTIKGKMFKSNNGVCKQTNV